MEAKGTTSETLPEDLAKLKLGSDDKSRKSSGVGSEETKDAPEEESEVKEVSHLEEIKTPESACDEKDVRVAVIGNVDSGKSTLVGVLTRNVIDDGRGSARSLVFNFAHEQANGRTSSIGQEIMGFDDAGDQVIPERVTSNRNQTWSKVSGASSRMVTFIDLCGHEKYLKTTIFGLVGLLPDYAMILIGANMGVTRMTKEHLGIALSLKVPIFIVITKVDLAPENVYKKTLDTLTTILKKSAQRLPVTVREEDTDIETFAEGIMSDRLCPIFSVSNVTGMGLPGLKKFLKLLKSRSNISGLYKSPSDPVEFLIDGVYMVQGVGIVAAGTVQAGTVRNNQTLMLGPDKNGHFKNVSIRSIHYKRSPVEVAIAGQSVCFNIKLLAKKEHLKRTHFRKGMILVDKAVDPKAAWEFSCEVVILHHATTIKENYQAVIHCGVIRQAAKVVEMSKETLRTGDKGLVRFRFMYYPEYLHEGMTVLFREGRTKGLGAISTIYHETKPSK
mmetsp:Transcript_34584/g.39179  ORF Transcript_34584/g.39179 Transcript_34584/m.39179 type:complete len:501 (+) Transcript_34584:168-1670(+)